MDGDQYDNDEISSSSSSSEESMREMGNGWGEEEECNVYHGDFNSQSCDYNYHLDDFQPFDPPPFYCLEQEEDDTTSYPPSHF